MKFSPSGLAYIEANPEECYPIIEELRDPDTGFREFLNHWRFVNRDTGKVQILGQILWSGQETYIEEMSNSLYWLYLLKARQLGLSTIEIAFDAYVTRFRPAPSERWWESDDTPYGENANIHIFSKREKDAQALLSQVKYGLERLPEWMRLPVITDNAGEYKLDAGENDERVLRAFPADNDTARSYTCTHAHLDEWAFMGDPAKVWQSIESSCAGSVHFITTGGGPQNYTSHYWRQCMTGDVVDRREHPVKPIFLHALNRTGRSEKWREKRAVGMTREALMQELPMTWEEAISGGGDFIFTAKDIDHCGIDFRGLQPPSKKRLIWDITASRTKPMRTRYITAWDIGRHEDAAVGIVLDVTEDVFDIVAFHRVTELQYPQLQALIETTWKQYGSFVVIEKNGPGEAVAENLQIPEKWIHLFNTTKTSKARIINGLVMATQKQTIKWDPRELTILDSEVRGYQIPDDNLRQDTVMSLSIAVEHAPLAYTAGRVMGIING